MFRISFVILALGSALALNGCSKCSNNADTTPATTETAPAATPAAMEGASPAPGTEASPAAASAAVPADGAAASAAVPAAPITDSTPGPEAH